MPVETAQDAKANPLRALKSLGSVDDFIVVKVDIDTPSIEEPLIAQILDDEGLSELIDELYFEHHVLLSPMRKWWATGLNDTGCAVQDSYALFHALRQRGIRAAHAPSPGLICPRLSCRTPLPARGLNLADCRRRVSARRYA